MACKINMCGIAGKIRWQGVNDSTSVVKMCDKMFNRGPDDFGLVKLENAILGHRRLSIIDLSKEAKQPMSVKDNRFFIVYNGEIYNFLEIRKELETLGFLFKTNSDTEVLLNSYIHWGADCLKKIDGMFSFAIWDNLKNEIFLARDKFGKKPLYYYLNNKGIIFASGIDALIIDEEVPKNISYESVNCFLSLGYILNPNTIYKEVLKLEPACYMVISESGKKVVKRRYWDYREVFLNKTKDNESVITEKIIYLLENAVKKRLISDVPVGAFLSGGIDSSSVVALMKKNHRDVLHTFSVGFDSKTYNEINDSKRAAEIFNVNHNTKICSVNSDLALLDKAIDIYDEPFADNSLIPTYELTKFTSSKVKVALSGDGADEIFAGYITYIADKYYQYAKYLPNSMKVFLSGMGSLFASTNQDRLNWAFKQKQFFKGCQFHEEKAHYTWRNIFTPQERLNLLGDKYKDLVFETDPFLTFKKYYDSVKGMHWLDRHLYVDAMTWLTDDILVKVDRASMHHSLEVRCPFLDSELVSYVASIPAGLKMRGTVTKYILKKSLRGVLPNFITNKRKSGFNAPLGKRLNVSAANEFKAFNKYIFERRIKHLLN